MLFASYSFLFVFLPITMIGHRFLPLCFPKKWHNGVKNTWLFLASLLFYAWGEPIRVLLMLGTILFNHLLGRRLPTAKHPKLLLGLAVAADLLLLFSFKYLPFLAGLFGIPLPIARLPLGISFYTFQAISYLVDVYRGQTPPAPNFLLLGTYIALFPQLIAGPILRYSDLEKELRARRASFGDLADGARLLIVGLCKKLLLANAAGALFDEALLVGARSLTRAWLGLFGFFFQIYFDFSGYSDMARGLGRMLGFHFPQNFNYPYTATSFTDFWRRWHITLSSFFKDYVYIPLGGNRQGRARTFFNLFIVWTLTGIWHGATPNFALWGFYWFLLLALEKRRARTATDREDAAKPPQNAYRPRLKLLFRRFYVLLGILFGWILFAFDATTPARGLSGAFAFCRSLLGLSGLAHGNDLYDLVRHLPFLLILAIGATPLPRKCWLRCKSRPLCATFAAVILPIAGVVLALAYLADVGYNPFLYFRF